MNRARNNPDASEAGKDAAKPKRPYVKPAFQHEKVFETMALACGKLGPTQSQCRFNRRNS
jgi:hypothetical protein